MRRSAVVVMLRVDVCGPEAVRLTLAGLSEQETSELELVEQARFTAPVKPLTDETVTVAEPGEPAAGVVVSELPTEKSPAGGVLVAASHAAIRFATSIDPSPVTWSYPVPAVNPMLVVPLGQFLLPEVHGTLLSPDVMS